VNKIQGIYFHFDAITALSYPSDDQQSLLDGHS
jgi:hypothetical protein